MTKIIQFINICEEHDKILLLPHQITFNIDTNSMQIINK
jgi:hypothetical protein